MTRIPGDTRLIPPSSNWNIAKSRTKLVYLMLMIYSVVTILMPVVAGHHAQKLVVSIDTTYNDPSVEDGLWPLTWSSVVPACLGRCLTKCQDIVNEIPPFNWTMAEELLPQEKPSGDLLRTDLDYCIEFYCSVFLDDDWVALCNGNEECLIDCSHFNDGEEASYMEVPAMGSDVEVSYPEPSSVQLKLEVDPNDNHSVMYVLEKRQHKHNWTFHDLVEEPVITLNVSVCGRFEVRSRAVNQFGLSNMTMWISLIYRPGPVVKLDEQLRYTDVGQFPYSELFEYSMKFLSPVGWEDNDMSHYEVFEPIVPHCMYNALPPYPLPPQVFMGPQEISTLIIQLDLNSFGCIYYTKIYAVSKCGLRGEVMNVTIDLTDCEAIENFVCPTPPYVAPGDVENITVVTSINSPEVNVSWKPPHNTGSHGISMYIVQWGFLLSDPPIPTFVEEQRLEVPNNTTSVTIYISEFDQYYAIKVAVMDAFTQENINDTLREWQPYELFRVPSEETTTLIYYPNISSSTTTIQAEPDSHNSVNVVHIVVPIVVIVIAIVIMLMMYMWRRHLSDRKEQTISAITEAGSGSSASDTAMLRNKIQSWLVENPFYEPASPSAVERMLQPDVWEIPADQLCVGEVLGSGAFGQVLCGTLTLTGLSLPSIPDNYDKTHMTVAVKMLHDFAGECQSQDFLKEIELMKQIGVHPNVVSIVGCCSQREPLCLVVEHLQHGDLLHYLRNHRHLILEMQSGDSGINSPDTQLTYHDLLSFARQIAVGMEYLSQRGFVHRDLATRNIMVGNGKTIKIGDFGLTRYIYADKLYVAGKSARLPLKWMAIEAIEEYRFNTETDVWSYGVLLFELVTLGGTPYPTVPNKSLLKHLKRGHRLEQPDNCTTELYSMMCECWRVRPRDRPTFSTLKQSLETMIESLCNAEYLSLALDETRDYYKHNERSTDTDSDTSIVHAPRCQRTESESTRGDSGVGDKTSSNTSQTTLHSTSTLSGAASHSWVTVDIQQHTAVQQPASCHSLPCIVDEAVIHPEPAAGRITLDDLRQPSTRTLRTSKKIDTGISSSFPILLPIQPHNSRLSTSSMTQLINSSLESEDSGSHGCSPHK